MDTVKTIDDLEKAEKSGSIYVSAICPKCGDSWTSLIPNAKNIITKGCLSCVDDNNDNEKSWQPKIGIFIPKSKGDDNNNKN